MTIISFSLNHLLRIAVSFTPSTFGVYITTANEFFALVHVT